MTKEQRKEDLEDDWIKDNESICFECASTFMLKVKHPGVALCLWCRIKEIFYNYRGKESRQ
jgi:hypothetical protein